MKRRFSKKPEPVTARRQLQYVRQQENESLEDFAHRDWRVPGSLRPRELFRRFRKGVCAL